VTVKREAIVPSPRLPDFSKIALISQFIVRSKLFYSKPMRIVALSVVTKIINIERSLRVIATVRFLKQAVFYYTQQNLFYVLEVAVQCLNIIFLTTLRMLADWAARCSCNPPLFLRLLMVRQGRIEGRLLGDG
jgi:hypothetical protein